MFLAIVRSRRIALFLASWCAAGIAGDFAGAQPSRLDTVRVSVLYTGRSFGALGVQRSQDEHELLTQQASAEGTPFKLVSHLAWRAPGIVVFMSGQEPEGDELPFVIAHRAEAERLDSVRALVSANGLLFQDPWRPSPDLVAILERNPRRRSDFPDLVETRVSVSRLRGARQERIYIVEEPGATWPDDPAGWTHGEMNRVDIADSRLFELPLNLGGLGPRATLLRRANDALRARTGLVLTVDLGHQDADYGLTRTDRARLDFRALDELGYTISVPFEFELGLGAKALAAIHKDFPRIAMLAANVRARDSTLFVPRRLIDAGPVRIGVLGLVHSRIRERLRRETLRDFTFEPAVTAARREVARLRAEGASAVIVFSNMDAADNASVANEVAGIDAIVADLPVRWAPESARERVELLDRPFARPGAPVLVARNAANGVGLGQLDLEFRALGNDQRFHLAAVAHRVERVTDRIPSDTALVRTIARLAAVTTRPRGELLFPAFVDLANRHPELRQHDGSAAQGRVSKSMWEAFMARLLRTHARAEVAVIRRLDQFPPLIGKLHENEIGAWLWTEDQVVVLDVLGSDLKALLRADSRNELAVSGIDVGRGTVLGHRIDDQAYYRVATVDVLYDGARNLGAGRRVRRRFVVKADGELMPARNGASLALKDFVFGELKRVRLTAKSDEYLDQIAALVIPDPQYINVLAFTFDRPTLWVSANEVRGREGYGSVPESRVTAKDSWVAGMSGRFLLSHERMHSATDMGLALAYARQSVTTAGREQVGESADDLKLDLTWRPSKQAGSKGRLRPFVRGVFDTEFTPTTNPVTNVVNAHQLAVRGSGGMLMLPGQYLRRVEFALAMENDFGRPNLQYGFQSLADFTHPLGVPLRNEAARATYRLRNDVTYFFPAAHDSPSSLALRYNMVHEVLIPLMDELSLSVAADMFVFKGKVDATRHPATSVLLRVGVTYDRLWKPRYQPFL